jgi:hypothetical protein
MSNGSSTRRGRIRIGVAASWRGIVDRMQGHGPAVQVGAWGRAGAVQATEFIGAAFRSPLKQRRFLVRRSRDISPGRYWLVREV